MKKLSQLFINKGIDKTNNHRIQLTIRFGEMLNNCDPCSFEANVYRNAIVRLNNYQDPYKVEKWVRSLELIWNKETL